MALPQNLPKLLEGERARKAEGQTELKDFCPVALVETGDLVKAGPSSKMSGTHLETQPLELIVSHALQHSEIGKKAKGHHAFVRGF